MDSLKSDKISEFNSEKLKEFTLTELLAEEDIVWQKIQTIFKNKPLKFEQLLHRIHYKRNKILSVKQRSRLLNFLSIGYLSTEDIRYFNEFLWFYNRNNDDKNLMVGCMERFNSILNKKGCHPLPFHLQPNTLDVVNSNLNTQKNKNETPLRVCLIGFPPFFGKIFKRLKSEGHHVEQFFLPYHPNRKINRLLKFKLLVKLLSIISGNFYTYRTLNYGYDDERISKVLRAGNFDLGFHKLNFILKENIFNSFKKGLLNDHWGYLPLLRGKSTISYSLLLNVPVIPTIHFINKGIDSGSIVGYYPCDYSKATNVKAVRNIIRKKMSERVVAAIKYAGSENFRETENSNEKGITFYEIHPFLNDHIVYRILNK